MAPPWQLRLYRASAAALSPLILLHMIHRRLAGLESDLMVRLGGGWWFSRCGGRRREEGTRLVWLHGASVGESLSALTLSGLLAESDPALRFVITSGTVSGSSMLSRRVAAAPDRHAAVVATTQAPIDVAPCVRRFLALWAPDAFVAIESELWPNMLWECHSRGMPLLLVDGRISPRSYARWRWPLLRGLMRSMLQRFSLVLCQSAPDARRLADLGARDALCVGSVKAASPPLPVDSGHAEALRRSLGGRLVWVAASTHEGEEDAALQAHAAVLGGWEKGGGHGRGRPPPLLVIVPRHAHRARRVLGYVRSRFPGAEVQVHTSAQDRVSGEPVVLVAAYMGATAPWMSAAELCFVGGSLVAGVGGHNVLEPALLGCAVLHGPFIDNAEHMVAAMRSIDGRSLLCVADAAKLGAALRRLCGDEGERAERAAAARGAAEQMGVSVGRAIARRVTDALGKGPPEACV